MRIRHVPATARRPLHAEMPARLSRMYAAAYVHPPRNRTGPGGGLSDIRSSAPRTVRLLNPLIRPDRKSTRLNSSHVSISYAVFCLKKKNKIHLSRARGAFLRGRADHHPAL